jgi:hypothetical protein
MDLSKLSLNLDGCRFGDGFQNLRQDHNPSSQLHNVEDHNLESHYINHQQIEQAPKHPHHQPEILSPLGSTYRSQELSIGNNFLRFRGSTVSGIDFKKELEVLECVGRGGFSSVWKARRVATGDNNRDPNKEAGYEKYKYYALKIFSMQSHEKRKMLLRELKLLCTAASSAGDETDGTNQGSRDEMAFRGNGGCECLVQLEGAFFDSDEGAVTLVSDFVQLMFR